MRIPTQLQTVGIKIIVVGYSTHTFTWRTRTTSAGRRIYNENRKATDSECARGEIKNNIIRPQMRSRLQWKRLMAARADELLVRSCFSLFGRAVEILISDDMSLPCDVNHPLLDGWQQVGRLRKFRQPEKREARAVTCRRNGSAATACAQVHFQPMHFVIVRKKRCDGANWCSSYSHCFIGLVYISTFWKQFIGMTMSTKQLGKLLLLRRCLISDCITFIAEASYSGDKEMGNAT